MVTGLGKMAIWIPGGQWPSGMAIVVPCRREWQTRHEPKQKWTFPGSRTMFWVIMWSHCGPWKDCFKNPLKWCSQCLKGKMTFLSENSHHSLNLLQGKLHRTSYCCNSLSYFPCPLPASGPRPGALHDIINSLTSSKQQIPCPSLQKLKMEIR